VNSAARPVASPSLARGRGPIGPGFRGRIADGTGHWRPTSKAEYPVERPLTPKDLLATIYRHLGIDYRSAINDFTGRPVHVLSEGEPIRELI
jgi:hypothetical protein